MTAYSSSLGDLETLTPAYDHLLYMEGELHTFHILDCSCTVWRIMNSLIMTQVTKRLLRYIHREAKMQAAIYI